VIETTIAAVLGVLAAGGVVALALPRLSRLRWQLVVLCVSAVVAPIAAVLVAGAVMFSAHDAAVLALVSGASAVTSAAVAILLSRRIARTVDRVRAASARVSAGDLTARLPVEGPSELAAIAEAFNDVVTSLARLMDTRRNLVAWASHDLRAPLSSLQAMIEATQDGLASSEYLPEMERQVRTLSGLVDDLFELSRIETRSLDLELVVVPVVELAAGCVRSLQAQAEARRVHLEVVSDGERRARCAPDKIERVLMNLLSNALRHTPSDGSVAVSVLGRDGSVVVAVEDTGSGLPAGVRDQAFDSFWRADAARTGSYDTGAGLGLAISRGLIEAHGGRIWAEERDGGGARFVFTLPAV
jgi:signal transduction histidine kinase